MGKSLVASLLLTLFWFIVACGKVGNNESNEGSISPHREGDAIIETTSAPYREAAANNKVIIAAASDLRFALDSIVHNYPQRQQIQVVYGSSGKMYEQISSGAPFDLYFSADLEYPKNLEKKGKTGSEIYLYAIGRLVFWSKKSDDHPMDPNYLLSESVKKIAIANPRHAPYGKRAEETLRYYELWDRVGGKLVFGENISQTAQFVSTGASEVGLIALSLALSPNLKKINASYTLIPSEAHAPLRQGVVITKRAENNPIAKAFFEFMQQDVAMGILAHFGFEEP